MTAPLAGLEQNYQYGLYGKNNPFGSLTVGPKVNPPTSIDNPYQISIPTQVGFVNDEAGNKISLGQDAVGCCHREHNGFMVFA